MSAPAASPSATDRPLPTAAPSSARSKLTALINAPAPNASTTPISLLGHVRTRPSTAPMINDDAATNPHPSAAPMRANPRTDRPRSGGSGVRWRQTIIAVRGEWRFCWHRGRDWSTLYSWQEVCWPRPLETTGSVEPVELSFDALFRRMVAAMCGGWLCGLVVAGVLGRLVMRILASESSPAVQGLLTDDQARVGEISLGGSIALALTGAFGGSIAGLVYLLALRILPASALLRSVIFAIFAAAVGGALFVHSYDSFDYSRLDPVWFGVASFIGLPALFGLVVPTVIDTLAGPDGWFVTSAPMVLVVIAAIVFSGPVVFLTAPAIGLAFIVQRTESLRRLLGEPVHHNRRGRPVPHGDRAGHTRSRRRYLIDPR